jgi:hypothetical protein
LVEVPDDEVPEEDVSEVVPALVVPPDEPDTPVIVDSPPLTKVEVPEVEVGVRVVISPVSNCRCSRAWTGQGVAARLRRRRCPAREMNLVHQS